MKKKLNLPEIVANNLIYYRKAYGYTQIQLAEKFNYSDKTISKWERGESFPDIFVLKTLADFYGITINDFFREKPKKYYPPVTKKRLLIVLLSVGLVWLVASIIYAFLMIFSNGQLSDSWLVFVFATIPTFIICLVFANLYKQRFWSFISVSGLMWCAATSIYIPWMMYSPSPYLFLIFIIVVPLQVLAFLWFLLKWSFKSFTTRLLKNMKKRKEAPKAETSKIDSNNQSEE